MFSKFYCKHCHKIKKRHQVKCEDGYYALTYYCRYCHNEVESVDHMLVRLDDEINKRTNRENLEDFHDWIRREAIKRYPKSGVEKKSI